MSYDPGTHGADARPRHPLVTHEWVPVRPPAPVPILAGEDAPLPSAGPLAVVEGLLRLPANVMHEVRVGRSMPWKLAAWSVGAMVVTGVFLAAFSGGMQLLVVPIKLTIGMAFCSIICLPSLYIFTALSGGQRVSLRETAGALLLGVALMGVLLVGFAPVSWVFAQATESTAVMGALQLAFFLVSALLGLRLTRRALAASVGRPVPALALWSFVFLVVALQLTTTLRPLVGPFEGLELAPRQLFLEHWLS